MLILTVWLAFFRVQRLGNAFGWTKAIVDKLDRCDSIIIDI